MPEIELTHPSGRTVVVEVDRIPSDMDAFAAEVFASLGTAPADPAPRRGVHPSMAEFGPTSPNKPGLGFGELGTRLRGIGVTNPRKGQPLGSGDLRRAEDRERFTAPSSRQYLLLEELKGHTARLGKAQRNYDKTPWYDILGKRKWKSEIDAVKARMAVVQDTLATLADYRPATRTIGLSEEQIRGRSKIIQREGREPGRQTIFGEVEDTGPDWRATFLEVVTPFASPGSGQYMMDVGNEILYGMNDAMRKVPVLGPILVGLAEGTTETIRKASSGDLRAIPEFFDPTQIPADPWSDRFTTEEKIQNTLIGMMAFYASKGGPPGAEIVPGMLYETPKVGITELRAGLRRLLKEEGLNEKQAAAIANMVEKQAVTATERVKAAAPQVETIFSRKEPITKEKPDAVQVKQTEEVLQDVRTQPGKGEEALPAQEGGAGIRKEGQAEEVVPVMGPKVSTPKTEAKPPAEPGAIPGGSTKPENITIGKFRVGSSTYGDALRMINDPERPFGVWREGQMVKKFATRDEAIAYAKEQQAKIDEAATQLDAERAKYPRLVWGKGEEGYIKSAPYREFFEGKSKAVEVGSIPQAFGHDEIVYFWRGKLVRRGSSKTSSGPAPVHEVPSDIVVWKQTKAARAIAPKFGATIETVRTKHVSDAGAMPGLLKPAKETKQVIVSPKPEPPPAKPKVEEPETITDEAQQFQEEVSPKSGGMGSRKRGAARGVDVGDTLAGVSEAVASVADRVAGKGLLGSVRDAVRGIFGNVRTKLEAYGKVGVDIANDLSAVLADAAHGTARDGFTIKESVRTSFGKVFGLKREARTSLGLNKATENIVHKIENGIPLTAKEKRVWDTWVTIQGRLLGEAKRHGVPVERQVGRIDPEILIGREVRWVEGGQIRSGKVIGGDADALLVETSAGQTVLERGTKFVSEQLVDPERYFPRVLKPEVYRDLFTEGSKVREAAVRHVMDTHGIGRADAEGVIHEAFGSGVVEIDSPISSRLRRERTGGLLPDEFYNRNFLEVVEAHIAKAHLDIAAAKKWGGDFAGLAERARQVPQGGEQVLEIVRGALSPKRDLATRSGLQAAAIEGAYQALTKLTMLPTAFIQLTQQASTIGLLGVKAWAKAWGQMAIDAVTGRRLIDAVKLSGAIDQDVLSLIGFSDLRGVVRDVTSGGLTPMRAMDRLSRVQSAVAGLTAVRDALMRVRLDKGGRIRNNAAYRFLREFAELNDEDILRMKQNGMTKDDAIRAMNTGAKTQVRTREVDLPDFAHTPFGRIFMRFKTYAYGQTALVGWAGKEAARGNLMPAARLIMAGVIAGQGVQAFRDAWNGWLYGEEAKRKTAMEKGQEIWAEFQNGIGNGASKLWEYAVGNLLDAGTLGLLGYAIEEADPKNSWKNQWEPVSAQTLMNIIGAVSYGFKNEEDWIDAWKAAGIDFSTKEALWVKAAWKMTHGGKTFRQIKQAERQEPSTPKSATKKVPDPLLSRPRRGSDPFAPPP